MNVVTIAAGQSSSGSSSQPRISTTLLSAALGGLVAPDAARRLWELTQGNALYLQNIVEQEVADGRLAVAIVPVSCQLSLKAAGAALGCKRVEMCAPELAEKTTGYVVGGISPLGQRKALPTAIDETCDLWDTIYVSGGRRGLDLGVAPGDIIRLLDATVAPITA